MLGNEEKLDGGDAGRELGARGQACRVNDIMAVPKPPPHLIDGIEGRTRAFVQVQNGCDHRCTFCIIPFGRGNSRSVPMARVVEQVAAWSSTATREIVLTGVDITSYGAICRARRRSAGW